MNELRRRMFWGIIGLFMKMGGIDPLTYAHRRMGILDARIDKNGEIDFLIWMKAQFSESLTMLDIGANVGEYSAHLRDHFINAQIHSFEPNPVAFEKLEKVDGISSHPFGLSNEEGQATLYTPEGKNTSAHGSILKDALSGQSTERTEISLYRLDSWCKQAGIEQVHFMKIDVEGHEIEVIEGLGDLLENVKVIQFEFNHHLIYSRYYLRDFYTALSEFDLFRIEAQRLRQLGDYDPRNEIFQMHNLVAIRKGSIKTESIERACRSWG